jgi:hypothetical protein
LETLRGQFDQQGCKKVILVSLDGGFCNRTLFGSELDRMELICRTRKDARLCKRSTEGRQRFYDRRKFTPEDVRKDESIAWQSGEFFHDGGWRNLRIKEVPEVYWQGGAKKKPLRLIVIAPTPYRLQSPLDFEKSDPRGVLPDWEILTATARRIFFGAATKKRIRMRCGSSTARRARERRTSVPHLVPPGECTPECSGNSPNPMLGKKM